MVTCEFRGRTSPKNAPELIVNDTCNLDDLNLIRSELLGGLTPYPVPGYEVLYYNVLVYICDKYIQFTIYITYIYVGAVKVPDRK